MKDGTVASAETNPASDPAPVEVAESVEQPTSIEKEQASLEQRIGMIDINPMEADDMHCITKLQELHHKVKHAKSAEEVERLQATWDHQTHLLHQLLDSLTKGTKELNSEIKKREKKQNKQDNLEKKKKEEEEVKQTKEAEEAIQSK